MKALLVALAILPGFAYADGTSVQSVFVGRNRVTGVNAPIFDSSGNLLSGDRYRVMIFGGRSPDSLTPVCNFINQPMTPLPFGEGSEAGYFRMVGYFQSPRFNSFGDSWLQVRAWDASLGNSYDTVAALGIGGYGESPVFVSRGRIDSLFLDGPLPMIGLQSFSLSAVVPEPETWALLGVGFTALAWFSRHRP